MAMTAPHSRASRTIDRPDGKFLAHLVSYFGFRPEPSMNIVDTGALQKAFIAVFSDEYFKQRINPKTLDLEIDRSSTIPVNVLILDAPFKINANGQLLESQFSALCPMQVFALGQASYPLIAVNIAIGAQNHIEIAIGASHVLDHKSVAEIVGRAYQKYENPRATFPPFLAHIPHQYRETVRAAESIDSAYPIPSSGQQLKDLIIVMKQTYVESQPLQIGFSREQLQAFAVGAGPGVTVNDVLSALMVYISQKPVRTVMDARRWFGDLHSPDMQRLLGTFMHIVRPNLRTNKVDIKAQIQDLARQHHEAVVGATQKDYREHQRQLARILDAGAQQAFGTHIVGRSTTMSSHQLPEDFFGSKEAQCVQQFLTGLFSINQNSLPQIRGSAYITGSREHPVLCTPLSLNEFMRLQEAAAVCELDLIITSKDQEGEILSVEDLSGLVKASANPQKTALTVLGVMGGLMAARAALSSGLGW